jgi:hypothetical protein
MHSNALYEYLKRPEHLGDEDTILSIHGTTIKRIPKKQGVRLMMGSVA